MNESLREQLARDMSELRDEVLLSLKSYLARAERLHDALRVGNGVDERLAHVFEADESLQRLAAGLVEECAAGDLAAADAASARDRAAALLEVASRLQSDESRLSEAIRRGQEAVDAADAAGTCTVEQVVQLAEQVSYSNAAPSGEHARGVAAQDGFRRGWGTPAPQQHMLVSSAFADLHRQRVAGPSDVAPAPMQTDAPISSWDLINQQPAAASSRSAVAVSLDLNPDDD